MWSHNDQPLQLGIKRCLSIIRYHCIQNKYLYHLQLFVFKVALQFHEKQHEIKCGMDISNQTLTATHIISSIS